MRIDQLLHTGLSRLVGNSAGIFIDLMLHYTVGMPSDLLEKETVFAVPWFSDNA